MMATIQDLDDSDLVAIFEIARQGINFAYEWIADELDLSNEEMDRLDKVIMDVLELACTHKHVRPIASNVERAWVCADCGKEVK